MYAVDCVGCNILTENTFRRPEEAGIRPSGIESRSLQRQLDETQAVSSQAADMFESLSEFQKECQNISTKRVMPPNFMQKLTVSCRQNRTFFDTLRTAGALTGWDQDTKSFKKNWNKNAVACALHVTKIFLSRKQESKTSKSKLNVSKGQQ